MRALLIFAFIFFPTACVASPPTIPAQPITSPTIPPAVLTLATVAASTVPPYATASPTIELTTKQPLPTFTIARVPIIEDNPTPLVSGSLWLQILSPQDEAIVDSPQISVEGRAPAESVVTVNDEILIVDSYQQFKSTLTLEEGPNLIEIIASDVQGNQISFTLVVIFEP